MTSATSPAQTRTTTAVIRAFTEDRLPATRRAIESTLNQTLAPDEVLVVIDHNPDLLAILHAEFDSSAPDHRPGPASNHIPVRVVPNERRPGIGGGSNTALLRASGDLVAYLDDDAVADPRWLEALVEQLDDPAVVGASGRTLPNWLAGEPPSWFPAEFSWVYGCSIADGREHPRPIRNVWGGNNVFVRNVLVERGGFLEEGLGRIGSRPVGCEDTELCIRITQDDPAAVFMYAPEAVIHHEVPVTRSNLAYFRSRCFYEGLSKALLSQHRGSRQSLADEADYTRRTLGRAVWRNTRMAATGQPSQLVKVAVIAFGLASATAGLIYGRARILVGASPTLPEVARPLV